MFHKKGALAAARDDNPAKASSNCQFYIVDGKTFGEQNLDSLFNQRVKPANPNFIYTTGQKEVYRRIRRNTFPGSELHCFRRSNQWAGCNR